MQTKMKQEWTFVTPAMAERWLANNPYNRKLKRTVVDRYAKDFISGYYMPNHQGIGIFEGGALADGQHRLTAIVQTGVGIWTWVCFDVPLSSKLMIDGGDKRTDFDQLSIAGVERNRKIVEIVNTAQKVGDGGRRKLSRPDMQRYIQHYSPALNFAAESLAHNTRYLSSAVIGVVLMRAWYTADKERLTAFAKAVETGLYENEADDQAALTLRNALLTDVRVTDARRKPMLYAKTENAAYHFLKRLPFKKLVGATMELFPIPPAPWSVVAPESETQTAKPTTVNVKRKVA